MGLELSAALWKCCDTALKTRGEQTKGDVTESSTITEFEMAQYHRFRAEFWNYEVQLKFNTENNWTNPRLC